MYLCDVLILKTKNMERFTDEQLAVLEEDSLKLYYNEAKERMASEVAVEKTITERCYMLFAFYYAIASACIGYVLANLELTNDVPMTDGCLVLFAFTCVSIYKVVVTMLPHPFFSVGLKPEEVNFPEWVKYFKENPNNQFKRLLSEEIVVLQENIDSQQAINEKRAKKISESIYFVAGGTLMAAVCFFLTYLILS